MLQNIVFLLNQQTKGDGVFTGSELATMITDVFQLHQDFPKKPRHPQLEIVKIAKGLLGLVRRA